MKKTIFCRRFAKGGIRTPEDNRKEAALPLFYATRGLRTCEVDGKPALFHRWAEEDKGVLKVSGFVRKEQSDQAIREYRDNDIIPNYCDLNIMRTTFAIVEYPDGSVHRVPVDRVRFTDRSE